MPQNGKARWTHRQQNATQKEQCVGSTGEHKQKEKDMGDMGDTGGYGGRRMGCVCWGVRDHSRSRHD